jgi:hypothetical protein
MTSGISTNLSVATVSSTATTYVGNIPKTLKPASGNTVTVTDNPGMTQILTVS